MELKSVSYITTNRFSIVLIVPLWNWNSDTGSKLQGGESFNRTFMELKYADGGNCFHILQVLIVPLWNWNGEVYVKSDGTLCFNRTFMELKYGTKYRIKKGNSF